MLGTEPLLGKTHQNSHRRAQALDTRHQTQKGSKLGKGMYQSKLMGFPHSSVGKESACNAGYLGSISGLGRSPREGKGYPLQYSGLEKSMEPGEL